MQALLDWLPTIGAILTGIIGLVGFFKPQAIAGGQNIRLDGPVAMSEARVVFGGIHLGYSIAALYFQEPVLFIAIGLSWFMGLLARLWSMIADGSSFKQSAPGIVVDAVLAFLFLSGLLFS